MTKNKWTALFQSMLDENRARQMHNLYWMIGVCLTVKYYCYRKKIIEKVAFEMQLM